jgi:hypothetical protein
MTSHSPATITVPHDGTGHVETDPIAGHTPGPWSSFLRLVACLRDAEGHVVAEVPCANGQDPAAVLRRNELVALITRAPEMAAAKEG